MAKRLLFVGFLNFCVNFLLLAGTMRLAGRRLQLLHLVAASALGAGYAVCCLLPGFRFLGQLHWRMVSLGLMSATAFGAGRSTWKLGGIFTLLTMAVGGLALAAGTGDSWVSLVCAVGIRLLSHFALDGRIGRRLLPVEITRNDQTLHLTALHDTGNELRDPVSGEAVMVIGCKPSRLLTGLSQEQLLHPLAAMGAIPGLRLIPYHAVGIPQGMLLAMRVPRLCINGQERSGIVAFAPVELGGDTYQALTGGVL